MYLKKCMFMINDPIQRCENVIVYDPHILLESIFSSLLPGNYLYLFTNFHTCILKTQVCGKWLHFTMWECHPLLSTHIVRVYFFIVIAWQQLVSVYQFSCLYLRIQICGKQPHFTMWKCHRLQFTHIVRVFFCLYCLATACMCLPVSMLES